MLYLVASDHCIQFQGKLMNQLKKMAKDLVLGPIFAQIWATNFFFPKNLASSVTRCHGQLSSCKIPEKTNDVILRKLSDRRIDGQTDGREWFHRTLSDKCRASNKISQLSRNLEKFSACSIFTRIDNLCPWNPATGGKLYHPTPTPPPPAKILKILIGRYCPPQLSRP